ncbi:copper resistance protein CopC [Streptomyces sp. NPDC093252]|uniref:copper resistance CopC/CopD family protein n=1 Tax=Streptomyces sp. NPDC093252 TaxID=3154980 RepID=UPI0034448DA3
MTQSIAPRLRSLVLLLVAVTGALFLGAAPASAHAAVTSSDPQQGAVVEQAPAQVSLTFSEPVSAPEGSVRVLGPKGERADTGAPTNPSDTIYTVKLHSGLPDGTYTVTYQVVSADSHPVAGAFTFSISAPSATSVTVDDQNNGGGVVGALYDIGRYISYAGFTVLAGGAAFVLVCWQRGSGVRAVQRLVVSGWVALTAATLWLLLLRGSYTGSGKVGDIVDLDLLGDVLQTKTGAALVSRLLLLAAAALFIAVLFGAYNKREDAEKRDLTFGLAVGGVVVAAGLAASWAMAEHASTGIQTGIAMPVDVLHLLAVAAWLGGLCTLLVALYRAPAETPLDAFAVRRFSRVAFGSVIALVVTGVYQSWRQLGSWAAFTDTRYGQLLLVKLGLVAVLVGIAWLSRRWTARLAEVTVASGAKKAASGAKRKAKVAVGGGAARTATSGKGSKGSKGSTDSKGSAGGSKGSKDSGDPQRAAQLARQRAAAEEATRKRLRDADPNRFGLRRSVLAEAGVAVVLLAVTTVLTSTEPGRTELDARSAASPAATDPSAPSTGAVTLDLPFDTGGEDGKGVVRVDIDPARVGANEVHVYAERPNGRAFDLPEIELAFTLKAQDIGPLPVVPDHITTGHWSAAGVQIPMPGEWQVEVTVRTSDIDQVTVSKNAQIG